MCLSITHDLHGFGSFFLQPYIFLPAPPQFNKSQFINLEVNHVSSWMRGCSRSKVCINCWFSDWWIWKSNFYYGLVDPEWFFSIMDFWIRNAYFELWIGGMVFPIMDVLHFFLFWINTVIHVLLEAPIWDITGHTNLKFYRKRQSKNLPNFTIQNAKK